MSTPENEGTYDSSMNFVTPTSRVLFAIISWASSWFDMCVAIGIPSTAAVNTLVIFFPANFSEIICATTLMNSVSASSSVLSKYPRPSNSILREISSFTSNFLLNISNSSSARFLLGSTCPLM